MHDLRINRECTRRHEGCEVHGVRFIERESVLDNDEDSEKLAVVQYEVTDVPV
jgi:hypothetical protein